MGIKLNWAVRVIGDLQRVYRSEQPFNHDNLPSILANVAADATSYSDSTSVGGSTYYYAIETIYGTRSILSGLNHLKDAAPVPPYVWSPIDLFASGEKGGWYDPSDLSTMYQDAAKTIPVTADGDLVHVITDKSGNGFDLSSGVTYRRPLYKTDGTYHWLQFDGVDDQLSYVHGETIGDFIIGTACRELNRQESVVYSLGTESNTNRLSGHYPWSDGNYYSDTQNVTTGRISGAWPHAVNSDAVLTHVRTASAAELFDGNTSLGTATNGTVVAGSLRATMGSFYGLSYYSGRIYGLCFAFGSNTPSDRSELASWMAGKAGVSL